MARHDRQIASTPVLDSDCPLLDSVGLSCLFAIRGASLSADGHTFLFSGIEHSQGDIILVESFR